MDSATATTRWSVAKNSRSQRVSRLLTWLPGPSDFGLSGRGRSLLRPPPPAARRRSAPARPNSSMTWTGGSSLQITQELGHQSPRGSQSLVLRAPMKTWRPTSNHQQGKRYRLCVTQAADPCEPGTSRSSINRSRCGGRAPRLSEEILREATRRRRIREKIPSPINAAILTHGDRNPLRPTRTPAWPDRWIKPHSPAGCSSRFLTGCARAKLKSVKKKTKKHDDQRNRSRQPA